MVQCVPQRPGGFLPWIPKRYIVAGFVATGILIQFFTKVCLSVAITAMVKAKSSDNSSDSEQTDTDKCPGKLNETGTEEHGDFDWDESMQGFILAAFYYGYICTQLLGGRLSELFGAKLVMASGVFIAGVLALLSEVTAKWHEGAFAAVRVLQGMALGVFFPSVQTIFSKWFPTEEHQMFAGIINSFMYLGSIFAMSLSGVLANVSWELPFYFNGAIAVAWAVPLLLIVHDSPEQHPTIKPEEKHFIMKDKLEKGGEEEKKSLPVPWLAIFTSLPVWATILMQTGGNYLSYTFLSELPTYCKNILNFDVQSSGLISSLPYLFAWIGCVLSGQVSQWIQRKGYVTRLTAYKIFNGISALGPSLCLVGIIFSGCDTTAVVALLVVCMFTYAMFYGGGSFTNSLDLGINYTGTLSGMNLTVSNSMGIVSAQVTGALTNGQQTLTQWNKCFYISIAVCTAPYILFLFVGSTKEQPWNSYGHEKLKKYKEEKEHKEKQ